MRNQKHITILIESWLFPISPYQDSHRDPTWCTSKKVAGRAILTANPDLGYPQKLLATAGATPRGGVRRPLGEQSDPQNDWQEPEHLLEWPACFLFKECRQKIKYLSNLSDCHALKWNRRGQNLLNITTGIFSEIGEVWDCRIRSAINQE